MKQKFKRFFRFRRYNVIPIVILFILLIAGIISSMTFFENNDNKLLFFITFLAFIYPLIKSIEKAEEETSYKRVECISAKSKEALEIKLNKVLDKYRKNKYRKVDIQIIDYKTAFIIITE